MKKLFLATLFSASAFSAFASGIEGKWRTIDDETGKPKAVVTISKSGSSYNGTITGLAQGVNNVCPACSGNRPLVGLTVVTGLKAASETEFKDGKIYDPKSGKTYQSKATLSADGNTLKVRGFIGISALGRTQTWTRVQ
ncbi:DUF2147 domain-containing protein [Kingella negevensis]|uniref:DUF2147 domain-containing protein n=1 Tax=Kingella negevensis TaxID=1522312 RepID=A0A238TDM6_9NEIS|nr:DUF2147 domain-containing protein [Kingella negevensis]MDK4680543.1 DUF2147 domain-containing protein [Kingella negevensis]MDK4681734.1 DUF2147 domain-containing protein [Kingella negevensis]MDK4684732.1 DUF2147 domain-containing protein [Kingella negevensis]MDK4689187.1 DUF2147 domain-containing protein [Kingella negevensis]MDK4689932.1 DUF2147 domain-containing protein [Kingella negevensis]